MAHVKSRALVKLEEEAARAARGEEDYEYETLEKGETLGPGGLDPAEVKKMYPYIYIHMCIHLYVYMYIYIYIYISS